MVGHNGAAGNLAFGAPLFRGALIDGGATEDEVGEVPDSDILPED